MYKIFLTLSLIFFFFSACVNEAKKEIPLKSINVDNIEKITKQTMLDSINKIRTQRIDCQDGLGLVGPVKSLIWNDNLYASAYEHSNDLAKSNTFSHDGSGTEHDVTGTNNNNKSSFVERIEANGYVNYNMVGENIAAGYTTVEEVIAALLISPKHCSNIMSSGFEEVGVAISINENTKYQVYWSQDFATKR
jgi:uncharacterized protein YkwD